MHTSQMVDEVLKSNTGIGGILLFLKVFKDNTSI